MKQLTERRDEGKGTALFHTEVSEEVLHSAEDDLQVFQHLRISMKPDRMIGLNTNDRYRELIASNPSELAHYPGKSQQLLYPFCIMEAKKERKAPGFRAVETQTAFPLRRLLLMQKALAESAGAELDPLVWFLANQGDIWRLYGAVPIHDKIVRGTSYVQIFALTLEQKVYDLWLGSIESEDGALQILQIMDFIWTWARDVYRPQIRRCLGGGMPRIRGISQTSTVAYSRAESVMSDRTLPQISQQFSMEPLTQEMELQPAEIHLEDGRLEMQPRFREVNDDPILSWSDPKRGDEGSVVHCMVRHSDRVAFVFRGFQIDDLLAAANSGNAIRTAMSELLEAQCVFNLTFNQIEVLKHHWLGQEPPGADSSVDTFNAVLLFSAYCDRANWQITRTLCCLIWSPSLDNTSDLRSGSRRSEVPRSGTPSSPIIDALDQLRHLRGGDSIHSALDLSMAALCNNLATTGDQGAVTWSSVGEGAALPSPVSHLLEVFNTSPSLVVPPDKQDQGHRILAIIEPNPSANLPSYTSSISHNAVSEKAVLVLKPEEWPVDSPPFCLFTWYHQEENELDRGKIKQVLNHLVTDKRIHRSGQVFPVVHKKLLARWNMSFLVDH
jgi:hypothetical protein